MISQQYEKDSTKGHHHRTSESQVNSNFPNRWSPNSLTFLKQLFLPILYLYIKRITINNKTPYLKSAKNPNRRAALGRPA